MKRVFLFLFLISFVLFFPGCDLGGSDDPSPEEIEAAEDAAVDSVSDLIGELTDQEGMPTSEELAGYLDPVEESFEALLELEGDNYLANTGMALISILRLYEDNEVYALGWSMADTFSGGMTGDMSVWSEVLASRGTVTVGSEEVEIDTIVLDKILPAIAESLVYIQAAIEGIDGNSITITDPEDDTETIEIDEADLIAFRTALYGLQGVLNMSVAIDTDMLDMDGEVMSMVDIASMADEDPDGLLGILLYNTVAADEEYEGNFLGFKNGENLAAARTSFSNMADSLIACYNSLIAETDDQSNDLIPNDNIDLPQPEDFDEINYFLAFLDEDADDIESIPDMAEYIKDVINGDVTFTIELTGEDTTTYSIDITPGAFFDWATTTENAFRDFLDEVTVDFENETVEFSNDFDFTLGGIFGEGDITGDNYMDIAQAFIGTFFSDEVSMVEE